MVPEGTSDSEDPSFKQASLFLQSAQRPSISEGQREAENPGFEEVCSSLADDLREARRRVEVGLVVRNEHVSYPRSVSKSHSQTRQGHLVRPLCRLEADQLVEDLLQKQQSIGATASENILLRRLGQRVRVIACTIRKITDVFRLEQGILSPGSGLATEDDPTVVPLETEAEAQPAPTEVLEGLYSIKSTPFECSFASRLYGGQPPTPLTFFQDWDTMSPWMELMADIMDHYRISQLVCLCPNVPSFD